MSLKPSAHGDGIPIPEQHDQILLMNDVQFEDEFDDECHIFLGSRYRMVSRAIHIKSAEA